MKVTVKAIPQKYRTWTWRQIRQRGDWAGC